MRSGGVRRSEEEEKDTGEDPPEFTHVGTMFHRSRAFEVLRAAAEL